nr:MAG TPA: hypothetical protein [Herelleviridae sp.]
MWLSSLSVIFLLSCIRVHDILFIKIIYYIIY